MRDLDALVTLLETKVDGMVRLVSFAVSFKEPVTFSNQSLFLARRHIKEPHVLRRHLKVGACTTVNIYVCASVKVPRI